MRVGGSNRRLGIHFHVSNSQLVFLALKKEDEVSVVILGWGRGGRMLQSAEELCYP